MQSDNNNHHHQYKTTINYATNQTEDSENSPQKKLPVLNSQKP